jgi:hypothetical protein
MNRSPALIDTAMRLSMAIVVLAALASLAGLLLPGVYQRETAWVVPQNRGQDLVTLLALALLVPTLRRARRGSPRATLIWLGLLGYIGYTYTGAAFAYAFNALFLVYVALFSLTGAALIAALAGVDASALRAAFDPSVPRRGVIIFLVTMALVLSLLWLAQIVPLYVDGTLPPMIANANTPTVFVFVLDLGVVVPLALLCAAWLRRDAPWGYVLAGLVLVKAATMGLALLSMTAFAASAGQPVELELTAAWVVLAVAGLAMSVAFFRRCRGGSESPARADASAAGAA